MKSGYGNVHLFIIGIIAIDEAISETMRYQGGEDMRRAKKS